MAVTVKIKDKTVKPKSPDAPPPAELSDYVLPESRSEGIKMLLLWLLFIAIGSSLAFVPMTVGIGTGIFLWWIAASIAYFFIAPRVVQRRLRMHGEELVLTAAKNPRLHGVVTKASSILGIDIP